jgi:hypothetical protein
MDAAFAVMTGHEVGEAGTPCSVVWPEGPSQPP